MKRTCDGCRALERRWVGGINPSPEWHCSLHYPIDHIRGRMWVYYNAVPTVQCPKPRTYAQLAQCHDYSAPEAAGGGG